MSTGRHRVCLEEGPFVFTLGLVTEALARPVWHVCLSSDALVSEDERLGSCPLKVSWLCSELPCPSWENSGGRGSPVP